MEDNILIPSVLYHRNARKMLSPRASHILFITVSILFGVTLLNHFITAGDVQDEAGGPAQTTNLKNYGFVSHFKDKIKPLFGGTSMAQHLHRSEEAYIEMLQQRKLMLEDYPAQGEKSMFPCVGEAGYWATPFTIWDFIPASFNCPHSIRRLGRLGDGGKWLCGLERLLSLPRSRSSRPPPLDLSLSKIKRPSSVDLSTLPPGQQPGCIIYSFGIQFESTFEEELIKRTPDCQVWGYDYSVDKFGDALKHVEKLGRAHFTKAGIAGKTDTSKQPPFYSVQDLMAINGHDHIDVLKVDIEGFEFETLESLVKYFKNKGQAVPVSQILVEIHLDPGAQTVDSFLKWWEMLEEAGFRPVWTEPNLLTTTVPVADAKPRYAEYSLINTKDKMGPFLTW